VKPSTALLVVGGTMTMALAAPARAQIPGLVATPSPEGELTAGRFRLRPDGSGGYVSETERFVARIAANGAVSFKDRKRLPGPAVWPILVAAQALQNATGGAPRDGVENSQTRGDALVYKLNRPTLTVGDDDLHRDTYHAQKMTFMEATASLRQRLRDRSEDAALASWRRQITALASDRRHPAPERRRRLFEQWADCEESPRGRAARVMVEAVARERFPAGSPEAYRPDELSTLNQDRAPGDRFEPYQPVDR
jgi:hypothetical protein